MPVGFGFSVGDFLAVLKLVGTVIDALRESSYASSSFRSLVNELYALESALLRVKRLDPEYGYNADQAALRQAATQCQRTIDAFYKKIQKYQPHLQQGGTNSRMEDTWAKIKWALCKKDDLETFRAEVRGHTSSIEILLLTIQLEATTTYARKQDSQHKSLASKIENFSCQAMGLLSTITDTVAQSIQQGKVLLESSAQVVQTNLRIFRVVHDIHLFILKIPGQVQRQQPVYFIDPLNRESPFHLEFVRSAEALLAILKVNLKESGCGPAMIDRGEFAIEELGTQNSINLTDSWDCCFYPGQRVAMRMIFKQQRKTTNSSCPRCDQDHQESTGKEITCVACGTIFRRIEELVEDIRATSQTSHTSNETGFGDVPDRPVNGPARPKRKLEEEDALANVRKFRRIQLVSIANMLYPPYDRGNGLVKVYEMTNNDWSDRGTGFCICKIINKEPFLHVDSEHSPGRKILEERIYSNNDYQMQQDTLIVWTDRAGTDMALSFEVQKGCAAIWSFINDVQSPLST